MIGRIPKSPRDSGSVAPLGIGLALVSLATILVFTSASSMFLLQRRLTSLAEFAALSRAMYGLPVETFLIESRANGLRHLRIATESVTDGHTSEVTLCSTWQSPVPLLFLPAETEICGQGAARAG
jgi:hypothetical protein